MDKSVLMWLFAVVLFAVAYCIVAVVVAFATPVVAIGGVVFMGVAIGKGIYDDRETS